MNRCMLLVVTGLWLAGCNRNDESVFKASAIVEGTAVKVSAQTGGYLVQVNFQEGDRVTAGQTLAVVDTEKLSYQLEVIQASAEELAVQRRLAETNVRRALEDHEYAKTKYDRIGELFGKQAATEQMRDDARIAHDRALTARQAARQNLQALEAKGKALEAQRKLLRRQIDDALVKSPLSGTITSRYFEAGETIPPNAPVAEIIDLNQVWLKVYVSSTYLPQIRLGQGATIMIDGTDQTLTGKVAWISDKAEFTPKNILTEESRTALVYAVKINIENPEGVLKHGMPVSVRLQPAS